MNGHAIAGFCLGAVVGGALTYILTKKSFEMQAQRDIDSIRAMYKEELKKNTERNEKVEVSADLKSQGLSNQEISAKLNIPTESTVRPYMDKPSPVDYAAMNGIAIEEGYTTEQPKNVNGVPYVISPDEVGDIDGYRCADLLYFADGILTDEDENPIDNPMQLVGPIALNSFGEYEEDSVCVRNDERKCDYVILKCLREWNETH